ncbi:hypothetical protein LCGC14_0686830 [marine sediment metagenome]|uniref:CBM-cenC domain-containing protein n=1 Tax=marine sediment metagenome TaxID=412755 RepID=A0A0F9TUK3_9ZZZZ
MIRPLTKGSKSVKLPSIRRKYYNIYGLDGGLDYSKGSTFIGDTFTPLCSEVTFRNSKVAKTKGTLYFAGTATTPLLGSVMHFNHYKLMSGTEKLMAHTTSQVYAYNSSTGLFENITRGEVVEDCEDVWSVNAPTTCATSTDKKKGTNSVAITIPAGEGTGVCAYENFAADDFTAATYLHFFIKSSIALAAADYQLVLGDTTAGGTPVGGSDSGRFNIPALVAGVWKEVSIAITTPGDLGTVESVALYLKVDKGAAVVNIDDVMVTIETTGDEDDSFTSQVMNDLYVYSNKIVPLMFWDMSTATTAILYSGCTLSTKCLRRFGERLCMYNVVDGANVYPQRVQWTIVGGISGTPAATDWTAAGSGNTDLEGVLGTDHIQTAERLGNYMVIYGSRTVALQDYVGVVDDPYAFYTRVTGKGLAAPAAIINLGNEHIFLGWDDIYSYKGGKDITPIGWNVKKELFSIINPEYVQRSFMVYREQEYTIRLYIPTSGNTIPNVYFSYNLKTRSWSRGVRTYVSTGIYTIETADSWDAAGSGATDPWSNQAIKWDSTSLQALSPISLYGETSGVVTYDDDTELDLAGTAIDGRVETKDFVVGDGYRRRMTNWMELNYEAKGDKVYIRYSTDLGASWSEVKVVTLTSVWTKYNYDFEANAPQVRFRLRNGNTDETFEVRELEIGFIKASDRGV